MREVITSGEAPEAIGPYSQAIRANGFVFTSGQIPLDPQSGEIVGSTAADQAVRVFENLEAVLHAAGSSLDKVVKITCFLTSMSDFSAVNEVFGRYYDGDYPARSCLEVSALPRGALVEIEAVALA
ncbi:MAG: RidA family protein [Spirochaetaceae bacterium]